MKLLFEKLLFILQFDRILDYLFKARTNIKLMRYRVAGVHISFVAQGGYNIEIAGDLSKINIHATSHLKSETFIECSGGVSIGRYFHVGRGLTIFSTNHNYDEGTMIPYDESSVDRPVQIGDFVWCGANVTIVPGVTVGEGVVIGAGSVVTRDIPDFAVVGGNPAVVLKYRDIESFIKLKDSGKWY